jgi:hypothetical protein
MFQPTGSSPSISYPPSEHLHLDAKKTAYKYSVIHHAEMAFVTLLKLVGNYMKLR